MVVRMTTNSVRIEDAVQKINGGEQEVMLDFSAVARIDGHVIRALEELAGLAEERSVKVVLYFVNIDIYRMLKQLKLTERFTF